MTLMNCRECGKLIPLNEYALCPDCTAVREHEMVKIRDCIRLNSNVSVLELSEATGIPVNRLLKFIHEGLIQCGG